MTEKLEGENVNGVNRNREEENNKHKNCFKEKKDTNEEVTQSGKQI